MSSSGRRSTGAVESQHGHSAQALNALSAQIFANIRDTNPNLEDLLKASVKYHAAMEAANQAAKNFLKELSNVAVTACKSRGSTAELGSSLQKVVLRHDSVIATDVDMTEKFNEQFIIQLQRRIKADSKTFPKMEEDFKGISKSLKTDMKKAGEKSFKAKKQVAKKGLDQKPALESANRNLAAKAKAFEEFNQRFLRSVMIEERRRYCYLVDNYLSVFEPEFREDDAGIIQHTLDLSLNPEELPAASEDIIAGLSTTPDPGGDGDEREGESQRSRASSSTSGGSRPPPQGGIPIDILRAQQQQTFNEAATNRR